MSQKNEYRSIYCFLLKENENVTIPNTLYYFNISSYQRKVLKFLSSYFKDISVLSSFAKMLCQRDGGRRDYGLFDQSLLLHVRLFCKQQNLLSW